MVSTFRAKFIGCATFLLLLLFCQRAQAVLGDCNNDGLVGVADVIYMTAYLEGTGPAPVNYADCDCDGFPGINYGDFYQITGHLFNGGGLFPSPGTDLIAPANTDIMISGKVDGATLTKTFIFINNPSTLEGGLTLPFSFAAKPGEVDLDCTHITINPMFGGSSTIDNVKKTFRLRCAGTVTATTNWEVLCEVTFAPQAGGSTGSAVTVMPTVLGRYFPLLVSAMSYDGIDFKRMLFPRFVPDTFGTIGDLNCDGMVDISDAVYVIAYIFSGGHRPGDPDGDGTPDCPGL